MSEFKVRYKNEALADDEEVSIPDVGLVKNGGTLTVTDEMQQAFKDATGHDLKESFEANGSMSVVGAEKKKEGGDDK